MEGINKQKTGFKFGKFRTTVIKKCGEVRNHDKVYKLVLLKTDDDFQYYSIRLYNNKGRFLKQLLFEPFMLEKISDLLSFEEERGFVEESSSQF